MSNAHIVNVAKFYLLSLAELMQEDIQQALKEWTDAGCPSNGEWSIDLTIDSIVADYRRDMERYVAHVVEAYDLSPEQAAELEREVC